MTLLGPCLACAAERVERAGRRGSGRVLDRRGITAPGPAAVDATCKDLEDVESKIAR